MSSDTVPYETVNPFDREADARSAQEHERAQAMQQAAEQGAIHAVMALAFLESLETRLTHEEALYLTAHIWRAQ